MFHKRNSRFLVANRAPRNDIIGDQLEFDFSPEIALALEVDLGVCERGFREKLHKTLWLTWVVRLRFKLSCF